MRHFKIRELKIAKNNSYGIGIPKNLVEQHKQTVFTVIESGPHLLLQSGGRL